MRKGALDMSLYPISYAGGEMPELNIGLMPGIVTSYEQGAAWKNSPVGQKFSELLASKRHPDPVAGSGRPAAWRAAAARS